MALTHILFYCREYTIVFIQCGAGHQETDRTSTKWWLPAGEQDQQYKRETTSWSRPGNLSPSKYNLQMTRVSVYKVHFETRQGMIKFSQTYMELSGCCLPLLFKFHSDIYVVFYSWKCSLSGFIWCLVKYSASFLQLRFGVVANEPTSEVVIPSTK